MTDEMKRVNNKINVEIYRQHAEQASSPQCTRVGMYIVSAALMMLEPYEGSLKELTGGYLPVTMTPADLKGDSAAKCSLES
jgi:hypothetical protein